MKSVEEIQEMLVSELWDHIDAIKSNRSSLDYYNELLGDTSYLLAGLLYVLLKGRDDWDSRKWLDDSLLTNVKLDKDKLSIWGIMIWGKENVTEQWTDPFYFEIKLDKSKESFTEHTFLFCDLDNPEISYEEFNQNRNYWNKEYGDDNRSLSERSWRYIINSKI